MVQYKVREYKKILRGLGSTETQDQYFGGEGAGYLSKNHPYSQRFGAHASALLAWLPPRLASF